MSDPREETVEEPVQPEPDVEEQEAPEAEPEAPEDTEADTDSESEAEPEPSPPPAASRRGSANERIRELNERRRQAERERDEARAEAERFRQQSQIRQETPQEREARLSMLEPTERIRVETNERLSAVEQRFAQGQREMLARTDRANFRQMVRDEPYLERVAEKVETEFQRIFREGGFLSREQLAEYFIGQAARQAAARTRTKQVRGGQERIARETVPQRRTGGSDVPARRQREDSKQARNRRVEEGKF